MKKSLPLQCPYKYMACDKLDTSTMTLTVSCMDCEHYKEEKGVRLTGSTPILSWIINLFKK